MPMRKAPISGLLANLFVYRNIHNEIIYSDNDDINTTGMAQGPFQTQTLTDYQDTQTAIHPMQILSPTLECFHFKGYGNPDDYYVYKERS